MTAPAETASNGTKPTPERPSGMARVRGSQTYHLASLAHDAAFEAERLCTQIYRTASDGYLREPATPETQNETDGQDRDGQVREAIACLYAAITYLTDLSGALTDF
jgi:hypothetical protein